MDPFTKLTAGAVPMDLPNIDTDRVIPARFLRKSKESGLGQYFFHDVRFNPDGSENGDFILNQVPYRDAKILVTAENFGCGSSREAAVWALMGSGFRCVIGPSFGDIFFENCFKNGALPIVVPAELATSLRALLRERPGASMTIDLEAQVFTGPDGAPHAFSVDPFRRECLLTGVDEIAMTLGYEHEIEAFEARHLRELPWLSERL